MTGLWIALALLVAGVVLAFSGGRQVKRPASRPDSHFAGGLRWLAGRVLIIVGVVVFVIWAIGALVGGAKAAESQERLDTAVVFLSDISGSMDEQERRVVRDSHAAAVVAPEVTALLDGGRSFAFSYVAYDVSAVVVIGWTRIDNVAAAVRFGARIAAYRPVRVPLAETNLPAALDAAASLFEAMPWPAERLVVDIVSDDTTLFGAHTTLPVARARLLSMRLTINALPLVSIGAAKPDLHERYKAIIGGPGAFVIDLAPAAEAVQPAGGLLPPYPMLPVVLRQKLIRELY